MLDKFIKSNLFFVLGLFIALLLLSFKFLELWFMTDDSSCIYASKFSIVRLFFDRETYLIFNKMFYTPLLPIFFKLDFVFFELNPKGYHIHNMLAAFFTALIGYKVYRFYLPRIEGWIGTFLFLLSYPVITNIGWITRKHYIWGTCFTLLSFYLFKKFEFLKKYPLFLASNVCYLIALLFKEAFAPLPGIILVLADGRLKDRILKSIPYFLILGVYLVLRFYIIGGIGGYIGDKIEYNIVGLIKNSVIQLNLFSSAVWGFKILFIMPILFVLFALNKRSALIVTAIFIITISPFFFLKMPTNIDRYFIFYFPSKFMLPLFIVSGALSILLQVSKNLKTKLLIFSVVFFLFVLQVNQARDSYEFIRQNSESYKKLALESINRLQRGDILIVHNDAIFYNYLYETISEIAEMKNKNGGAIITFNDPDIQGLLNNEYSVRTKYLYLKDKWVDLKGGILLNQRYTINDSIHEPQIKVAIKNQFINFTISDRRDGIFYGVLKTIFSDKNISFQSMTLQKGVPVKVGLVEGKEIIYLFYCVGNQCSKPLVLKPKGRSKNEV